MRLFKNERDTENIVRDTLRALGYYDSDKDIRVEEQKSNIDAVKRLLRTAGKSGKGGTGAPEFIVSAPSTPDFLLVVECKADQKDHISPACKEFLDGADLEETAEQQNTRTARSACDGVLHYARYLSKDYNVIAVAVSGQMEEGILVSVFLHPKGGLRPKVLGTRDGTEVSKLLSWSEFIMHGIFDPLVQRNRFDDLMAFSHELHDFMRDHAKLTESEKPLVVSGTLIALRNAAFGKSYDEYTPEELQKQWFEVIHKEFQKAAIPQPKTENMTQPYSSISVHPELGKPTKVYPKGVLHELIKRLHEKVYPFISIYHDFDVVGRFYGEFLKYTGGDKKALGIVLTPRHVTELFALLANVNKDSTVLDICAGTGGFLISAMVQMMRGAQTIQEEDRIRKHGLIGVEQQPNMFALAASNMILRGDGKANLHQGSCFDEGIVNAVKAHNSTVGLLNPPFSQGDADLGEMRFIRRLLNCLQKGGTGVIIVPMSCAIAPNPIRAELMSRHTLEAVMSMPDDLFYPVGTVTCIMVWTAHVPHADSNKKTWFGYWKNDGFMKTKHRGRVDLHERWPSIRDRWVEQFRNREVQPGESVTSKVGPEDEWCAEAYMETDYTKITQEDFERTVINYAVFRLLSTRPVEAQTEEDIVTEENADDEGN